MRAEIRNALPLAGGEWLYTFAARTPPGEWYDDVKGKTVEIEIKRAGRGRSRDANAFCWALCSDIGRAMTPPLDKEDVYRDAIRAVGVYTPVIVVVWDIEKIRARWESRGTGWFVEVVDDAGAGKKLIHLYYGSSTYTVDEMRVLLERLVDTAEQMQLPIPLSRDEEERLLERWGNKK